MSKKILTESGKTKKHRTPAGFKFVQTIGEIAEYRLSQNDLRILYLHRPGTGVITTNITYFVGARDEARGETGLAHMLEHMLFKPTKYDLEHKITSGSAMHFERQTGSVLNANTWKDRTTYYFSYPKEYFCEALRIEADRMQNVILSDKVFRPEQGNVLSEFDMYNGDPHFALAVQMYSTAFLSHPYGHETIGYREDIEDYTPEKLDCFYKDYYRPDNAILMVVGDISKSEALNAVSELFGSIANPHTSIPRHAVREPKQEGTRRVYIERPSTANIISIGFKHAGFPTKEWFITHIMLDVLAGGPESILHKLLIDTGKAAAVGVSQEPTSETNLGMLDITLSPKQQHNTIEILVLKKINSIVSKDIDGLVKKAKAKLITDELFGRTESLHIVSELTEYASAGDLHAYSMTPDILTSITTKDVMQAIEQNFKANNLTIGHFIGTLK
ncbi:MAG: insulinase family protein [Candidatus Pacebacteria bacterium]|nr:insulinase family protein [Candidatus Paceibacterota bacterium]